MKAQSSFPLRTLTALTAAAVLVSCGTVRPPPRPGAPEAPELGFFSRIRVPDRFEPVLRLKGTGVQIFRCEAFGREYLWHFRQPEANLTDDRGQLVARHGANFTFEHRDGSRLVATITAYEDAPSPEDLRWVLMSAKSFGRGALASIAYVQRVNTHGGMPPPSCLPSEVNRLLRVDFSADFIFYRAHD